MQCGQGFVRIHAFSSWFDTRFLTKGPWYNHPWNRVESRDPRHKTVDESAQVPRVTESADCGTPDTVCAGRTEHPTIQPMYFHFAQGFSSRVPRSGFPLPIRFDLLHRLVSKVPGAWRTCACAYALMCIGANDFNGGNRSTFPSLNERMVAKGPAPLE